MDRCKCKKCGKLCNLNRFEMCKDCLQIDKVCKCGASYRGGPKSKSCPSCNKATVARHYERKAQLTL